MDTDIIVTEDGRAVCRYDECHPLRVVETGETGAQLVRCDECNTTRMVGILIRMRSVEAALTRKDR